MEGPKLPNLPAISFKPPSPRTVLFVAIVFAWLFMTVASVAVVLLMFLRGDEIPDLEVLTKILVPLTAPAMLIVGSYLNAQANGKEKDNGSHNDT
jgi:hypothetical protein